MSADERVTKNEATRTRWLASRTVSRPVGRVDLVRTTSGLWQPELLYRSFRADLACEPVKPQFIGLEPALLRLETLVDTDW